MTINRRKLMEVALPLEAINRIAGAQEVATLHGAPMGCVVRYVRHPVVREPDFGATSVNYDWGKLWASGGEPC
jgi:hypothetical protein